MEHRNERNIICPYCGWEDEDSWEFDSDEEVVTCRGCEKEFNVTREIEVTYSTSRIECEPFKHDYKLDHYFISKRKHIKGDVWADLPENEWKYIKIVECNICDDKDYIEITKDEYEGAVAKV